VQGLPPNLTPATEAGRAGLAAILAAPRTALVALDYDGTLAPIVTDPSAAWPHPDAAATLARLAQVVGALAVISGRPATGVLGVSGLAAVAGLERAVVFGLYGTQRWSAGRLDAEPAHAGIAAARAELPQVLADLGPDADGVTVEDKGQALAVHTRTAAEPHLAMARLADVLGAVARTHGLELQPGRHVLEICPPGADKGQALLAYAAETGARAVLYAGDDLGDLAAFRAVRELRRRGVPGLAVAVSTPEAARERAGTAAGSDPLAAQADLVVRDPGELVALLAALAELARS
jgi:trehalose 6-phosphate phosphatase